MSYSIAIVTQGLLGSLEIATGPKAGTWWRVSPKGFSLQVESLLPVTAWDFTGEKQKDEHKPAAPLGINLAVAPMRPPPGEVWKDSRLKVELIHAADKVEQSATADFKFERLDKRYPASLWGAPGRNGDGRDRMVDGTTGLVIAPHTPVQPGTSSFIRRDRLDYDVSGTAQPRPTGSRLHAELPARSAEHRSRDRARVRNLLNDPAVIERRNNILMSLAVALAEPGLDPARAVRHSENLVDAFVYAPQISKGNSPS